jgi:hypothetical protein
VLRAEERVGADGRTTTKRREMPDDEQHKLSV